MTRPVCTKKTNYQDSTLISTVVLDTAVSQNSAKAATPAQVTAILFTRIIGHGPGIDGKGPGEFSKEHFGDVRGWVVFGSLRSVTAILLRRIIGHGPRIDEKGPGGFSKATRTRMRISNFA